MPGTGHEWDGGCGLGEPQVYRENCRHLTERLKNSLRSAERRENSTVRPAQLNPAKADQEEDSEKGVKKSSAETKRLQDRGHRPNPVGNDQMRAAPRVPVRDCDRGYSKASHAVWEVKSEGMEKTHRRADASQRAAAGHELQTRQMGLETPALCPLPLWVCTKNKPPGCTARRQPGRGQTPASQALDPGGSRLSSDKTALCCPSHRLWPLALAAGTA